MHVCAAGACRDAGVPEPVWLRTPGFLPSYYDGTTKHYQSDGWMSGTSGE